MTEGRPVESHRHSLRTLASQAFARAAGAPLVEGNAVRLLRDAAENYPAWLEAIAGARSSVHFDNYIVHDDEVGARFADAFLAAAARGVRVRVIYDWLGCLGASSSRFWKRLQEGGVEVRPYNPPRLDSPLGWLSRNHRKMLAVDGEIAFVSGLCVGRPWEGDPARGLEPWRDTGVELRGPVVAEVEQAFSRLWAMLGPPIPDEAHPVPAPAGETAVRIIASTPTMAGMLRLDQLLAALAHKRIWLSDAYFAGGAVHVQALCAAARSGVDVRLLLPNATDVPLIKPVSRAGYRPLLEAGVRIFEWNGTMMHAKTAVVDGLWARIGSTNLNFASWIANCELDALVEDERFAAEMEAQYLADLANATEVVLAPSHRRPAASPPPPPAPMGSGHRAGAAVAGAVRVGHALGAAIAIPRVLEPAETVLLVGAGAIFLAAAVFLFFFPKILTWALMVVLTWFGLALILRGWHLRRGHPRPGMLPLLPIGPQTPPPSRDKTVG